VKPRWTGFGILVLLGLLAGVVLALTACAPPASSPGVKMQRFTVSDRPAPAAEQILRRQISDSPRTLDPSLSEGVPSQNVLEDLFEGLTTITEDGRVTPGVAKSWNISNGGKTYLFHLRPDARWSNGAPVTAADFVYAWRREVNPNTGTEYAEALDPIVHARGIVSGKMPPDRLGVRALGPHTLQVELNYPTPYFLALLSNTYLYPLYPPAIKKWGGAWTLPEHMVSNGAFYLKQWVINGHLTLAKNPYYWDAKTVRLRQVIVYSISDPASALSQYLAGGLDWLNTPAFPTSDTSWVRRRLGKQVVVVPYYGNAYLGMLVHEPPFNNRDLRLAMSMALDRRVLTKDVMRGLAVPAYTLVPPLPGYRQPVPAWARWSRARRLAAARRLYHLAGYSTSHPLRVKLVYPTGGPSQRQFMEALAIMWKQNLGADVTLWNEQWKVFLQNIQYKHAKLFWSAWIGDYPDPFTFMQLFQKGFAMNYGDYDNPAYQRLVAAAQREPDNAKRYRLFTQAGRVLDATMPYIPMYFYVSTHLVKPYVGGWKSNIMDRHLSRYMYILAHRTH